MSWKGAALAVTAGLCLIPVSLQAQDAPADNTKESNGNPPAEPPVVVPQKSGKGLLGPVRIGPSVALGFPHPLTGGVDIVYEDLLSVSVTGGRAGAKVEEVEVEIRNWDAAVRIYPFQGSFFIGAAYGSQGIVGKTTTDVKVTSNGTELTVPTTIRLEVEGSYLTPQIGWFARWDSGFTLGFDFGYQMPSGVKTDLQTSFANVSGAAEDMVRNSEDYKKNKDDVEKAAENFGKVALPYITLIRLGWLF